MADLLVGGSFVESDGEVNNTDVDSWNSEGHSSKLSSNLWEDETYSLSSTSGGWDDVLATSSAESPVLLVWSINLVLTSSNGVDCGHKTLLDSPVVVEHFGKWCKAVGCAGGVGHDLLAGVVLFVVNTNNVGRCIILSRCGEDNSLGASLEMTTCKLLCKENTSGLTDDVYTLSSPWDFTSFHSVGDPDSLAVNSNAIFPCANLGWESAVSTIVLEEVLSVFRGGEGIVHSNHTGFAGGNRSAEDEAADSAETINTKTKSHFQIFIKLI